MGRDGGGGLGGVWGGSHPGGIRPWTVLDSPDAVKPPAIFRQELIGGASLTCSGAGRSEAQRRSQRSACSVAPLGGARYQRLPAATTPDPRPNLRCIRRVAV